MILNRCGPQFPIEVGTAVCAICEEDSLQLQRHVRGVAATLGRAEEERLWRDPIAGVLLWDGAYRALSMFNVNRAQLGDDVPPYAE